MAVDEDRSSLQTWYSACFTPLRIRSPGISQHHVLYEKEPHRLSLFCLNTYTDSIITPPTCNCLADAVSEALAMPPSSHYSRRARRDKLSISVLPEQSLDPEPQSPYLHWLFGESSEIDINSRLAEDDSPELEVDDGISCSKTDAVIMREVAAWLELPAHDELWVSRRKCAIRVSLSIRCKPYTY